jgi:hypothetical protein
MLIEKHIKAVISNFVVPNFGKSKLPLLD